MPLIIGGRYLNLRGVFGHHRYCCEALAEKCRPIQMTSRLCSGKLVSWKDGRGFGFIKPSVGGAEVFLHISELKALTRRPTVGDTIYYRVVTKGKKHRACDAFIQDARLQSAQPNATLCSHKSKHLHRPSLSLKQLAWQICLLACLPLIGSVYIVWEHTNPWVLVLYVSMSLCTFALYADDKKRAVEGRWRIPEKNLHFLEMLGGWLGGYVAQQSLRHKNKKQSYQIVFWSIAAVHLVSWLGYLTIALLS